MHTALYIRVSTADQAEHGHSIKAQEHKLRAFCEAKNLTDIKTYIDDGYSGASLKRPMMQTLIEDVQNDTISTVVVYKLDRLSRSQKDTLHLIEDVLNKHDTTLISVNESFDTSTSFGRAMVGMLSVFAQLERENIRERVMMGRLESVKKGRYLGGYNNVPFGYRVRNKQYVVDDYEAMIVKEIFHDFIHGKSGYQMFNDINVKYGEVIKSHDRMMYILKNPFYCGKIRYANQLYDGQHKALVSTSDFEKVQIILQKKKERKSKYDTSFLILKGLIYCGKCGAHYTINRGWTNKQGVTTYYYMCSSKAHRSRLPEERHCDQRTIRSDIFHDAVVAEVAKLKSDEITARIENDDFDLKAVKDKLDKVNKQIEKVTDLYLGDFIEIEVLKKKSDALYKSRDKLLKQIEDYSPKAKVSKEVMKTFEGEQFEGLDDTKKRQILALIIDKITVNDEDVTIKYNFSQ